MNEPTLVILAAGLSSRYGSLKQIDPVGPGGEFIIDYSVYDAIRAGFKRVVFLIAPDMRRDFEDAIGRRVSGYIETAYAYQSLDRCLPEGFSVPAGRVRPWGTAHALLCCREAVDGPFAMINADDFYGAGAYRMIYAALRDVDAQARPMRFSMVGYRLGNTVTDSGRVCRGACRTRDNRLDFIEELTYVVKTPDGPAYSLDGGKTLRPLGEDTTVSMNFWGFRRDRAPFPGISCPRPGRKSPGGNACSQPCGPDAARGPVHRGRHAQRGRLARHDLQGRQARGRSRNPQAHRPGRIPRTALGVTS